ncbi:diacylglycerol kinase family protein [Patescibacteria group bacterium]
MRKILSKHRDSFKDAFAGLWWSLKTQPNFKIHILLSILALWGCWFFALSDLEIIIIIFAIVLGLAGEMINTSIEAMTDLITDKWHQKAKIAKDVSAGMMLVTAFGAFFIASIIFLPHVLDSFGFFL